MTIPTPTLWTPPWYAVIPDFLCVLAVPVLLKIWWWCINNPPESGTWVRSQFDFTKLAFITGNSSLPSPPLWIWSTEILFQNFQFNSTWQISGGGQWRKACRSRNKESKQSKSRENSRNLLEAFLRSRKEENLYGHCDMNNARRILSAATPLRGCWFWSKKLNFQKNFFRNFIAVEGVRTLAWGSICSNPFWFEFTGVRPESNRGPADNPNLSSDELFSTELWWRMHHRRSFRTLSLVLLSWRAVRDLYSPNG